MVDSKENYKFDLGAKGLSLLRVKGLPHSTHQIISQDEYYMRLNDVLCLSNNNYGGQHC